MSKLGLDVRQLVRSPAIKTLNTMLIVSDTSGWVPPYNNETGLSLPELREAIEEALND